MKPHGPISPHRHGRWEARMRPEWKREAAQCVKFRHVRAYWNGVVCPRLREIREIQRRYSERRRIGG